MSLTILFVDRDTATTEVLVPGLERKGHEVTVARSLHQALARLGSFRPDILVVDVASFGRSGYKVVDGIRPQLPDVPAILMVTKGDTLTTGDACEVLSAPFSSRSLLFRVAKIAKTLTSRDLHVGPLLFEPDTRLLHRIDQVMSLRPKEAALLALFMRNPGRVLSRKDIVRAVWETDYCDDTRTLSVHVRWLRLKIEEDPHRPRLLRTVRGVGYRFDADEGLSQP
jgi:DNA-binding response OmpR family regulator